MVERPLNLKLIVIWQYVAAAFWGVGLLALFLFAFPFSPGYQAGESVTIGDAFGMGIGTIVIIGLICLSVTSGVWLNRARPQGWALGVVNTALSLLIAPFGTIVGVFVLIGLFNPAVRDYFKTAS